MNKCSVNDRKLRQRKSKSLQLKEKLKSNIAEHSAKRINLFDDRNSIFAWQALGYRITEYVLSTVFRSKILTMKGMALIALALSCFTLQAEHPLPTSDHLINNLLKRAETVVREKKNPYTYEKKTVTEELDATGKVTKSTEKLYEVVFVSGMPFSRLVKIEGQPLNPEQIEKQNQREQEFRKRVTSVDLKQLSNRKESWLTKSLVEKYEFTVESREIRQGRTTLLVKFQPKAGNLPTKTVQDRVLNHLTGTIWVDEEEYEIVKCSIQLTENVFMGIFGIIGNLSQFDLAVERLRMPDGIWLIANQTMQISGRQLFINIRNRTTEKSSGFKHQEFSKDTMAKS